MAPGFTVPIRRGFIPARGFVLKVPDREKGQASGRDGAGFLFLFFLFSRRFSGLGPRPGRGPDIRETFHSGDFPLGTLQQGSREVIPGELAR